jgi:hypothetical protein
MGPAMLWVLLPAGATYYRNPVTGITEGQDSPDVQAAILAFLRRPDHTMESRSESIRAIELALAQNIAINVELLRWIALSDADVQMRLMRNLTRTRLTPEDFAYGKTRVKEISEDPAAPAEVRSLAREVLGCWINDPHQEAPCPALHP